MVKLDMDSRVEGLEDWGSVLDKLLVGLTHNISNRVATLAGVSDILSGDPTIPPILRALADEVPRLERSIRLLRLLTVPDEELDEAVETTRIVDDAIALAELHPDCRNISFAFASRRDVPPVVAHPTVLTHAIVVALTAAAAESGRTGEVVSIPVTFVTEEPNLIIGAGRFSVRALLLSAGRN
ncbi:MAG: hypothetical protein ABI035_08300 [Gemmatimonadaceae bacterium]